MAFFQLYIDIHYYRRTCTVRIACYAKFSFLNYHRFFFFFVNEAPSLSNLHFCYGRVN